MICKCEDDRHGPDGCLIPNDGEYDEICQACYTRCYRWHIRENIPHRVGKAKIKECQHEKHKSNPHQKKKVKEFESDDIHRGEKVIKRYCTHCVVWFEEERKKW